jgi:transcriptional regulator
VVWYNGLSNIVPVCNIADIFSGGVEFLIKVIDSPCGSGKTMWSIQYINKLPAERRVVFVTPFLSECDRIIKGCSRKRFVQPSVRSGKGRKINDFLLLVQANKNIATTHALFSSIDSRILKELKLHNYTLIVDEAMNVLNKINIYSGETVDSDAEILANKKESDDIRTFLETGILKQEENDKVSWDKNSYLGKYDFLKHSSDTGNLFIMDNTLLMWTFSPEIFLGEVFKEIYILTYQFDFQIHSYYFKYYNIEYEKLEVFMSGKKCELFPYGSRGVDLEFRRQAKDLIEICENSKMNSVGSPSINMSNKTPITSLSIRWYKNHPHMIKTIQNNVTNFWKNIAGAAGNDRMWTCFKDNEKIMSNQVLCKKNFIAINARATNDFANKKYLCYLANRYINPCMIRFFSKRGVHLNQDEFALAELIQWIWRSAIRNGEKIYLYIPSERMRNLLKKWLDV